MADAFKFEGGRELERVLLELPAAVAKRPARFSLRKAAKPILDAYRAGTTVKSGNLVQSETMGTRLNPRQRRLNRREGPSDVEIHIGTADPAGLQEELGIRQQANPALTRAWDAHGGEHALATIGKEMWASIERMARRAKKG